MAVLRVGRVAGKQEICTAEVIERSGTASPGRFRGHRENLQVPWQTCTFACTLSQLSEITCFVCRYLSRNAKHLKSFVPQGTCRFDSGPPHRSFLTFRQTDLGNTQQCVASSQTLVF